MPTNLSPTQLLGALQRDAIGFADAAETGDILAKQVRSCPDWTGADLVWHLGEVHLFWRTIAGERFDDWRKAEALKPERPADDGLLAWYRAGADETVRVLTDADPAEEVWTWASQKDIAFIIRRMAQETAVHRWDAEDTAGNTWGIEPAIAIDGIDEFFEHFFSNDREEFANESESVHLHCTDVEGEWLVRVDGTEITVTKGHAKGDAAARGTASDLLLLLWRRITPDKVDVVGDAAALDRFLSRCSLD
jgi:uncharacterized protein (TIGR03083 family)